MHIRKRGNTWSYIIHYGTDPKTGKPNKKEKGGFKSPSEAEKAGNRMLVEIERGEHMNSRETLKGFMESLMKMPAQIKSKITTRTYEMQMGYMNNHILPELGHMKMIKIAPKNIVDFYNAKVEEGLSPGTIHNIANLLHKVFRFAAEWGIVNKNPVQAVGKPTYKSKQHTIWTTDEVQTFMEGTANSRFHIFYVLALTTGIRAGENAALQWRHIDFNNGTVSIQQTVEVTKNNIAIKDTPKNSSSRRLITLPQFVVKLLREYKLKQSPNRLDLITPGIKNELLYPSVLTASFKLECQQLKMPKIRVHDMRHTHATILLQMGVNPKVVQERLGHASITTTMNTYSHVIPSMQKETADKLDEVFSF